MLILPSCISFANFSPFLPTIIPIFCLFQIGFAILSHFCQMCQTFAKHVATGLRAVQIVPANTTVVCHLHIMLLIESQYVVILHKYLCNVATICSLFSTCLLTWWEIFWHLPQKLSPWSPHFFHPIKKIQRNHHTSIIQYGPQEQPKTFLCCKKA